MDARSPTPPLTSPPPLDDDANDATTSSSSSTVQHTQTTLSRTARPAPNRPAIRRAASPGA